MRRGDDSNAFGFSFLTVNLKDSEQYPCSKAEIRIGNIIKTFDNPVFPIEIELNREETMALSEAGNKCRMAVYDMNGLKWTPEGGLCFKAEPKEV